jgi:hypothetical protein
MAVNRAGPNGTKRDDVPKCPAIEAEKRDITGHTPIRVSRNVPVRPMVEGRRGRSPRGCDHASQNADKALTELRATRARAEFAQTVDIAPQAHASREDPLVGRMQTSECGVLSARRAAVRTFRADRGLDLAPTYDSGADRSARARHRWHSQARDHTPGYANTWS